jgi:Icc protein
VRAWPRSSVRAERLRVFAVEDTAAQVCWGALPPGDVTLEAGGASITVTGDGRPGAAVLDGLPPGERLELTWTAGGRRARAARFRTLRPPPGRLLCRFATVNDLHVGETRFGLVFRMREGRVEEPYPVRCARAALAEALAWGAETVVAKGDLTWAGLPWQWDEVGRLLAGVDVPVHALFGNHDVGRKATDGGPRLAAFGIEVPERPWAVDLPGIRLVMVHTAVRRRSHGQVDRRDRDHIAELVGDAPGAAFLAMHHYPQRFVWPNVYPPGIPGPVASALLDGVAEANTATLVSSGHSHRNRRHHHGPLVVTEIGSTKDYPGVWAGYAVHEGGIRQVVRRVAEPSAIGWTERTRRAVGGIWGLWSPGLRSHRCFSHTWPSWR